MALYPSLYLSSFEKQQKDLKKYIGKAEWVFVCLHLAEEFESIPDYKEKAKEVFTWLKEQGFRIMADVSHHTLQWLEQDDLVALKENFGIDSLRVDYGFTAEEIIPIAEDIALTLNAIAFEESWIPHLRRGLTSTMNYYPRPETGVSLDFVKKTADLMKKHGVRVLGFIPGDESLRLPLMEGLPTVEQHRYLLPFIAYLQLVLKGGLDGAIVADTGLSEEQFELIRHFDKTGQILVPVSLEKEYHKLYHQPFHLRKDSPEDLLRIVESREYSMPGPKISPRPPQPRLAGCITIDNELYQRYSGEIQILKRDYPIDHRVNVIGRISYRYRPLLDILQPGMVVQFIPER